MEKEVERVVEREVEKEVEKKVEKEVERELEKEVDKEVERSGGHRVTFKEQDEVASQDRDGTFKVGWSRSRSKDLGRSHKRRMRGRRKKKGREKVKM